MEHLAHLLDHLVLFLVVAVIGHLGVVREEVEGDLVREHRVGDFLALGILMHLVLELAHRRRACPRGGLVGGDHDLPDADCLMDRPHRGSQDRCRAVRIGDDALVALEVTGIHFRHDQRRIRIHAEGRRVVDHDRARGLRCRHEFTAACGARGEEGDVDALEGASLQQLDGHRLALEVQGFADRALRSEKLQFTDRKIPAFEHAQDLDPDGSGSTNDRNILGLHVPFPRVELAVCLKRTIPVKPGDIPGA
jgi:hypothetical protein